MKQSKKNLVLEIHFPMSSKTPVCSSSASQSSSLLLNNKPVLPTNTGTLSPNSSRTGLAMVTSAESVELRQSPVMGSFSEEKIFFLYISFTDFYWLIVTE